MHGLGSERSLSYESLHCFRMNQWPGGESSMNELKTTSKVHPRLLLKLMQLINYLISLRSLHADGLQKGSGSGCAQHTISRKFNLNNAMKDNIYTNFNPTLRERVEGGAGQLVLRQ